MTEILVVDDEPASCDLLAEMLESAGYAVWTAKNGPQGYQLACELRPDCILLDVDMKGMDGGDVARLLEKNDGTRHIPIVFCTGLLKPDEVPESGLVGRHPYLAKPFKRTVLLERLSAVLSASRGTVTGARIW